MTLDPISAGPARNVELESKVLGCLLLLRPTDREFFLSKLTPLDFHDPVNRWLYSGLRVWAGALDGVELYERLAEHPGKPSSESFTCLAAFTIFFRDGSSRLSMALLPCYLAELQSITERRRKYDEGIQAIIDNHHTDNGDWQPNSIATR